MRIPPRHKSENAGIDFLTNPRIWFHHMGTLVIGGVESDDTDDDATVSVDEIVTAVVDDPFISVLIELFCGCVIFLWRP